MATCLADLEDIRINAEVTSVSPGTPLTPPTVQLAGDDRLEFDAVVLATHSDVSLKLLGQSAQSVRTIPGTLSLADRRRLR